MAERYVICTRYRPGPGGIVGVGKHVWWELEQARKVAQQKLPNVLKARIFIGAVDADDTDIAPGPGGNDAEERWRVVRPTPARYVETVRHSEERVIELTEIRMTKIGFAEWLPISPGAKIEIIGTPAVMVYPHHIIKVP